MLEDFGTAVAVPRDREIHGQDAAAESCYRLLGGCVRTVRLDEGGRRHVAEFLLPGDFFGFASAHTHDFAAQAVSDAALLRYPRRLVEALAERDGSVSRRLREMTARDLRAACFRLLALTRNSAAGRLAGLLHDMARRLPHGNQDVIDLPMGRTDIADHLGLTAETVSRTMTLLKGDGIIWFGGTTVQVRDSAALERLAGIQPGTEPEHTNSSR
jgi:CRP-like cAMP-binding protein